MTIPIVSWKHREDAKTKQEAVAALADFTSSSHGIYLLMSKENDPHIRNSLLEAKAYAEKWEVPFSLAMLRETMSMMSRKRFNGETNIPLPKRGDFEDDPAYYAARQIWRNSIGTHIWVSSSEQSSC